jgi:fatty acid kinase fatty acid binding subunit
VAVAGVAVVTDSTSSLPRERAALAAITVIPLQVVIGEQSRPETEVAPGLVAAALRDGRPVSTSRPSPEAFEAAYDALAGSGYQAVVSVHLSGRNRRSNGGRAGDGGGQPDGRHGDRVRRAGGG